MGFNSGFKGLNTNAFVFLYHSSYHSFCKHPTVSSGHPIPALCIISPLH